MEKITKDHSLSQSENLVESNIDKLKALFPEIVTEGKIDFKVLQEVLGNELEEGEEYYRFTWAGKANARREAQKPSTGTLRPAPEESVDWDTTQNLYIEGDNLEVLKLLQKGYAGKVKMIYIDPPYNTGKDFVYKDNYKDNLRNYQEVTGQIDDEGNKLSTNSDSDGRFHSNWLNMMYPRLRLARNLLSESGLLFVSIDDNESSNLKKLLDEVFGEDNFINRISWRRRHNQPNDKTKMVGIVSESIFIFGKKSSNLKYGESFYGLPLSEKRASDFTNPDSDPNGKWTSNPWKAAVGRGGSSYVINTPSGEKLDNTWYGNEETFKKHLDDKRVHWTDNGSGFPRIKIYLKEKMKDGQLAHNFWGHKEFGSNQDASNELSELFSLKGLFDNPKPVKLLTQILSISSSDDDLILDFFSGSASTAHSIFESNILHSAKRQFIQVQLPEEIDEKEPAYKAGYRRISDLGKERIRRAAKKIAEEYPEKAKELDLGFKVFKLDTSNIKGWDGNPDNLDDSLFDAQDNIKTDRTEHDVLYEILLKYGLDLTLPIEEKEIAGKTVFSVGYGALFICLADTITSKVAEGIGKWKSALQPEVCRVVFKDSGFTDVEKTNSVQILKRFGITEIKSI
ncbi:site-specific DNA-methyltransferase [Nonlabens ponticola]|uniref:site-specific DNA-methyltransferase (adenine-specific) n=1 Tax=Nonlabens ponticola TaxID=2496866 RepID=A0A3S9N040_9FLAO|nr:site-specific DNA-methyltransferase [Nonlabens ponticola]AZQ44861.1 site-specific DNA-methyltransferase [Nonlabens ponticola]